MSYIHHMIGGPNAAGDYEEYLERLRAQKRARRNAESGRKRAAAFDSPIEEDRDSAQDQDGRSDGEDGDKPGGDAEGKQGWSAIA